MPLAWAGGPSCTSMTCWKLAEAGVQCPRLRGAVSKWRAFSVLPSEARRGGEGPGSLPGVLGDVNLAQWPSPQGAMPGS